jgi:hypothetical protein
VLTDEHVKEKRGAAKDGITSREKELRDLNQLINGATNSLAGQVERYNRLSLSGSLSAQIGSAVRLLKQHHTALENKGMGPDQLLVLLNRKLVLLNSAKGQARNKRVGIASQIKTFFGWL